MAKNVDNVSVGVDIDGDGKPDFAFDIKTIGGILVLISTIIGMWFALQADIEEAKKLPEPEISITEYDLKDQLIRETIMNTGTKVEENSNALKKIDDKLFEIISK